MATTAYDIIKRPIITEQSMEQTEMKRYTFEVAKTANKIEIAKAIEEIFGVKVAKVNTLNMQGKAKRMGNRPAGRRAVGQARAEVRADFQQGCRPSPGAGAGIRPPQPAVGLPRVLRLGAVRQGECVFKKQRCSGNRLASARKRNPRLTD